MTMLKIFKKRRQTDEEGGHPLFRKLSVATTALQRRWADRLQEKSERLSLGAKKWLLGLFVLIFGGMSVFIAWRGLTAGAGRPAVVVSPITVSSPAQQGVLATPFPGDQRVSSREYEVTQVFQRYLDSLGQSTDGQKVRDSLLRQRPGLLDSIRLIERMYLAQPK